MSVEWRCLRNIKLNAWCGFSKALNFLSPLSFMAWSKLMNNFMLHNAYNSLFHKPLTQKSYDRQLKWKTKTIEANHSDLKTFPQNQLFSGKRNIETTNRTTMNCAFHAGRRYGKSGRISNFFLSSEWTRGGKNHFHENIFLCLFVRMKNLTTSSTNNKLWWFLNDSTDFSRLLPFRWDHAPI